MLTQSFVFGFSITILSLLIDDTIKWLFGYDFDQVLLLFIVLVSRAQAVAILGDYF